MKRCLNWHLFYYYQKFIVCYKMISGRYAMKLFNTYSNQLEEFKTIEPNKVKMYVCGPTVYDYAHLGHARCYITWDVLYRYLKFRGYDVTYCRNVTDVDDKILKKAESGRKKMVRGVISILRCVLPPLREAPSVLPPQFCSVHRPCTYPDPQCLFPSAV